MGTQLVRYRAWPRVGRAVQLLLAIAVLSATLSSLVQFWLAAAVWSAVAVLLVLSVLANCATAMATFLAAMTVTQTREERTIS